MFCGWRIVEDFLFHLFVSMFKEKHTSNYNLNIKHHNNFAMNETRMISLLLHAHFLWLLEYSASLTLCIYTYHKIKRLGHVFTLLTCNAAFPFPFHDF